MSAIVIPNTALAQSRKYSLAESSGISGSPSNGEATAKQMIATVLLKKVKGIGGIEWPETRMSTTEIDQKKPERRA